MPLMSSVILARQSAHPRAGSSVILGGTFSILHAGHRALLAAAKPFSRISIGLTTDHWARTHRIHPVVPVAKRRAALRHALAQLGLADRTTIFPLSDRFGTAASDPTLDAIIVSSETKEAAEEINKARKKRRLKLLSIIAIPMQLAQDGLPFSATRIQSGVISPDGRRLHPLRIAVGSDNPSKIDGVRQAYARAFPNMRLEVRGFRVRSGVGEQPVGYALTSKGAQNRAKAARHAWPSCDYAVGLESGLIPFGSDAAVRYFDIQFCCMEDGRTCSFGCSMGFPLPKKIQEKMIKNQKSSRPLAVRSSARAVRSSGQPRVIRSLGSVVDALASQKHVGRQKGAIHFLSRGLMERKEMTEQAVLCALVERRSPV